jgi:hypothetical protein
MTDSSQAQIRIYAESTWGETPSTGNKMTDLNITNDSLIGTVATKKSAIIRSDANIAKIGRISTGASGSLGVELMYGGYDSLFEGVLRSTFGTALSVSATTISAANSDNSFTGSGGSEFTNAVVGQWVQIAGFTESANNGFAKITSKPSNAKIIVAGLTIADEAAGDSVTIKGAICKNGVTEKSFLIEKQFSSSLFDYFTGMEVNSASFNFALDDLITGSFDFVGKAAARATSTQGDGSPTAAASTDSMNTIENLTIYIDDAATSLDVTSFNFSATPNLREKKALGNLGAIGVGGGTFNITGSIELHNEDNSLLTALDNFTTKSLSIIVGDAAGNDYVFDFPSAKLTSGARNVGGQDQDVIQSLNFECQLDTTDSSMMGITRIPA